MKRRICVCLAILLLCLTACTNTDAVFSDDVLLRIYFLDAGQGDCILIRTPDGDILIDSGPESEQGRICMRLASLGIERFRLAVFTHPDEDHIGGADGILSRFPAEEIWMSQPERDEPNESERQLWSAARACGAEILTVSEGKLWRLGNVVFYVMAPQEVNAEDTNESSVVLKLTCREASALFTGDLDEKGERMLVKNYGAAHLSCQLYKVGHHGSSTSSSEELIEAMLPVWAVISCESGNAYGHPHGEVLARLAMANVTVLRTDRMGEIVFDCDGKCFLPIEE